MIDEIEANSEIIGGVAIGVLVVMVSYESPSFSKNTFLPKVSNGFQFILLA